MIINPILLSIFRNFLFSSFSSLESFRHFPSLSRILPAISVEFFRHFSIPFYTVYLRMPVHYTEDEANRTEEEDDTADDERKVEYKQSDVSNDE